MEPTKRWRELLDYRAAEAAARSPRFFVYTTSAAGEFSFDAMLRDLAGNSDRATARVTAKSIEDPAEQLELAGAGWPWRPTALLALTVTAAIGVALLPAAAARRNRR